MKRYKEILDELSGAMGVDLRPDQNGTCCIQMGEGLEVYVEPGKEENSLLIGLFIDTVPPGKGREKFFQSALIANGQPYPRGGTLAYSRQADKLVTHQTFPLEGLDGTHVATQLRALVEQAIVWKEAVKRGQAPFLPQSPEPPA